MTDPRQTLCDLMDGRLQGEPLHQAITQACASDEARADWHAWHVAGDVLRSTDLAACQHDAAFAADVMARIEQEGRQPAPIPQAATPAANDQRWKLVAGLASFAAVAAIGWNLLGSTAGSGMAGAQLAQGAPAATPVAQPTARAQTTYAASTLQGDMLRDSRLDEFLAAHRQAAGASALGQAQGFLRNATFMEDGADR